MEKWPDASFTLLERYVDEFDYRGPLSRRPCASVLRRFQRFVMDCTPKQALSQALITAWLHSEVQVSPLPMVIRRAQIVDTFLDWLVLSGHLAANPFADLRATCRPRGTRSIVPALLGDDPDAALASLRPLPRFGSHLGPALRTHVDRMRTLGYRYDEGRFAHFDHFIQTYAGAETQSLAALVKAYAGQGTSPSEQLRRLTVGRVVAESLRRTDPSIVPVTRDRLLVREAKRQCRQG